jgi:hypothetical protein
MSNLLGQDWIVTTSKRVVDLVSHINNLSYQDRVSLVDEQRKNLQNKNVFSVNNVISFLESLV